MKGIILHGGSGTRLRPLTYTDVKQLLPIAGKPISEYALENIAELGIKEINIVIGSVGGNEVKNYYGDGSKWNIRISYTYQDQPLGIAHAIGLVKDFVRNDDFVVFLGDNYLQDGISKLYENYISNDDVYIFYTKFNNALQRIFTYWFTRDWQKLFHVGISQWSQPRTGTTMKYDAFHNCICFHFF